MGKEERKRKERESRKEKNGEGEEKRSKEGEVKREMRQERYIIESIVKGLAQVRRRSQEKKEEKE